MDGWMQGQRWERMDGKVKDAGMDGGCRDGRIEG